MNVLIFKTKLFALIICNNRMRVLGLNSVLERYYHCEPRPGV